MQIGRPRKMISALTSKEDSDRLIRDLMKKTKDFEKQLVGMKQAHADGATALQEALAERAAMAEQFGQLKSERDSLVCCYCPSVIMFSRPLCAMFQIQSMVFAMRHYSRAVQDTKYQSLKGKHGKLKEKAAALKETIQEFETVLQNERAQYKELEEALEDHQSQAHRRERQLSNDLVLVTQVSMFLSYCTTLEHRVSCQNTLVHVTGARWLLRAAGQPSRQDFSALPRTC